LRERRGGQSWRGQEAGEEGKDAQIHRWEIESDRAERASGK
jgi:hypothetical protein